VVAVKSTVNIDYQTLRSSPSSLRNLCGLRVPALSFSSSRLSIPYRPDGSRSTIHHLLVMQEALQAISHQAIAGTSRHVRGVPLKAIFPRTTRGYPFTECRLAFSFSAVPTFAANCRGINTYISTSKHRTSTPLESAFTRKQGWIGGCWFRGEMNRLLHQASPRRTRKESKLRSKVQSALPVSLPLDPSSTRAPHRKPMMIRSAYDHNRPAALRSPNSWSTAAVRPRVHPEEMQPSLLVLRRSEQQSFAPSCNF
jgi:hypothetical protein